MRENKSERRNERKDVKTKKEEEKQKERMKRKTEGNSRIRRHINICSRWLIQLCWLSLK